MEKFIEVYDNLFEDHFIDNLYNKIFLGQQINYTLVNNITSPDQDFYPGISHVFYNFTNGFKTITPFCAYLSQVLFYFCLKQDINLLKLLNGRLFINFPIIGFTDKKHIHTDLIEDHLVLLYYVNDVDGDTIFFDENNNEIKRVSPKKGRCIFFNGSLLHTGSYPTKNSRAIINYNFIGEKF